MYKSHYYLLSFGFQFREEGELIQMHIKEEGLAHPQLGGEAPRVIPVMHYHSTLKEKYVLVLLFKTFFFQMLHQTQGMDYKKIHTLYLKS